MDSLSIGTGLDSPRPINKQKFNEVMTAITEVITELDKTQDPEAALACVGGLIDGVKIQGLALARLLHALSERWAGLQMMDDFADRVHSRFGLSVETVKRYVSVWEMIEAAPADIQTGLAARPMRELIMIKRVWQEMAGKGETLRKKDWQNLIQSSTTSQLGETGRELLDKPPRKNGLILRLKRDGSLIGIQDGTLVDVGFLRIDPSAKRGKTGEIRKHALERIINSCGILEE